MKALIPAAGLGTRFLPATKAQPKEMLLVVDKPAIQYVVEEGLASAADEVVIINSHDKKVIEEHFSPAPELVELLRSRGKDAFADAVEHAGNLKRAAVDLAQYWRSDKAMRSLEALMIVADEEDLLVISGNGEVIAPDKDVVAIGSGGNYAYSAAVALFENTDLDAETIVRKSLEIASNICVYTNNNITVEKL